MSWTIFAKLRLKGLKRLSAVVLGVLLLLSTLGACAMIHMPGKTFQGALPALTDDEKQTVERLKKHVEKLAGEIGDRNLARPKALKLAEDYIAAEFAACGYTVQRHSFQVDGQTASNLVVEIKGSKQPEEILVVGGHYDSAERCPAANDNGSGTAATLELARLFAGRKPSRTLRFVAFVNEEPPHFQTAEMGGLV